MDLVIKVTSQAPGKRMWHSPEPSARGDWSEVYELITNWFCSSHDFNKNDNIIILYEESLIHMEGESLRYLGPSLRSAASLSHKAFNVLPDLSDGESVESTPGITVYQDATSYDLAEPHYRLVKGATPSSSPPTEGSLFCFAKEGAQPYTVPASRLSQGLVWYLQERSL